MTIVAPYSLVLAHPEGRGNGVKAWRTWEHLNLCVWIGGGVEASSMQLSLAILYMYYVHIVTMQMEFYLKLINFDFRYFKKK